MARKTQAAPMIAQVGRPFRTGEVRASMFMESCIADRECQFQEKSFPKCSSRQYAQAEHPNGILIAISLNLFTAYTEYYVAIHSLELVTKIHAIVTTIAAVQPGDVSNDLACRRSLAVAPA